MSFVGYQCFKCGAEQPRSFDGYTCPSCDGNLELTYDYALVKKELRRGGFASSTRRDIFRYSAFLPVTRVHYAPPLQVGMTPLYHAMRLGALIGLKYLYVKDDGLNPSASFKDRAGAVALVRACETGAKVIAGASTGNAGSSMACLSASVGMPCVVFVPETAPPAKLAQLLIFGAKVIAVRGSYDDAFDLCMEVCERKGWFNRNTGYNPFTREGKKTCSFEICEQMGRCAPDRVIVPTGDGNIISGIWKGMRDLFAAGQIERLPRIDCAQSAQSDAICRMIGKTLKDAGCADTYRVRGSGTPPPVIAWDSVAVQTVQASTVADSISVDLPRDGLAATRAVIESGGEACAVNDSEILQSIAEVARVAGIFVEPAAACAWACLKRLVREGRIGAEEKVVCLFTGNGLKDVASARKVAGEPVVVDPTVDAAIKALEKTGL